MNIVLLGAPGAGKGTQAEIICDRLHIPQISTGNILRQAIKDGTEMGLKAKSYMDAGNLVPDEVIFGILHDRLGQDDCKNGFILDGVPRTIPQAEVIEKMGIKIDVALDIEVRDEVIVERVSGRRVCSCGASYHIKYKPSRVEGICDKCGGGLILRDDDKPETVLKRLGVYHEQTQPLIDYYTEAGVLKEVDGTIDINDVFAAIVEILGE